MSYAQVEAAVPESINIVSDGATVMDMEIARRHMAALDELPRPTVVTCRTGPRASAVVYLYAGLEAGASADEVLARAEADGAPFTGSDELKAWVSPGPRRAGLRITGLLEPSQVERRPALARGAPEPGRRISSSTSRRS